MVRQRGREGLAQRRVVGRVRRGMRGPAAAPVQGQRRATPRGGAAARTGPTARPRPASPRMRAPTEPAGSRSPASSLSTRAVNGEPSASLLPGLLEERLGRAQRKRSTSRSSGERSSAAPGPSADASPAADRGSASAPPASPCGSLEPAPPRDEAGPARPRGGPEPVPLRGGAVRSETAFMNRPGSPSAQRRRPVGQAPQKVVEPSLVGLREVVQDVARHAVLVPRMPDAEPHPHVVRPDMGVQRAQAVVPGMPAPRLHFASARGKVELVVQHDHLVGVELVEPHGLADGAPGLVHVGGGLEDRRALVAQAALRDRALETSGGRGGSRGPPRCGRRPCIRCCAGGRRIGRRGCPGLRRASWRWALPERHGAAIV